MPENFNWYTLNKDYAELWLTTEVIQRLKAIAYNSRSLNSECGNEFYGSLCSGGRVVIDQLGAMCLVSDPGAGSKRAASHSFSVLDDPAAMRDFRKFWATARTGDCVLNVHTHMSGQYRDDGSSYDEYWKFSNADMDVFKKTSDILIKKGVNLFSAITYVCGDGNIGFAVTRYDADDNKFYHTNKIKVIDPRTKQVETLASRDGHQFIGSIYN